MLEESYISGGECERVWEFNVNDTDDAARFAKFLLENQTNTWFYFDDSSAVVKLLKDYYNEDDVIRCDICRSVIAHNRGNYHVTMCRMCYEAGWKVDTYHGDTFDWDVTINIGDKRAWAVETEYCKAQLKREIEDHRSGCEFQYDFWFIDRYGYEVTGTEMTLAKAMQALIGSLADDFGEYLEDLEGDVGYGIVRFNMATDSPVVDSQTIVRHYYFDRHINWCAGPNYN